MKFLREMNFKDPSVLSLVGLNLALLVFALLLNWSAYNVILAFWIENLVIGVFFLLKLIYPIIKEKNVKAAELGLGLFITGFFFIHFYGFCFVHGVFIVALIGGEPLTGGFMTGLFNAIDPEVFWVSFGVMFLNHGISFITNFIGNYEFESKTMNAPMLAPYKRIFFVHLFIMVCGILFVFYGKNSAVFLVIFVLAKVFIDLRQHFKSHPSTRKKVEQ